jgi:hypothetical protein
VRERETEREREFIRNWSMIGVRGPSKHRLASTYAYVELS